MHIRQLRENGFGSPTNSLDGMALEPPFFGSMGSPGSRKRVYAAIVLVLNFLLQTRQIFEQDPSTDDSRLAFSIARKQYDAPVGSEADDGRMSQT